MKQKQLLDVTIRFLLVFALLVVSIKLMQNIYAAQLPEWAAGELLINYQGGFVRRGILGYFLQLTSSPLYYANLVQKISVFAFFVLLIIVCFVERNTSIIFAMLFILFFSSGGLLDWLSGRGFEYADRKEVWFYVVILLIILIDKYLGLTTMGGIVLLGIVSIASILHHELFVIYFLPPIFCVILVKVFLSKKPFYKYLIIYLMLMALVSTVVVLNHGDVDVASKISQSYSGTDAANIGGGIDAIGWSFSRTHGLSVAMIRDGSISPWLFYFFNSIIVSILMTVVVSDSIGELVVRCSIIIWLCLATLISSYAGWDWGRWISMFSIGYALMLGLSSSVLRSINWDRTVINLKIKLMLLIGASLLLLAILSLSFRMPHCCPQGPSIEIKWFR